MTKRRTLQHLLVVQDTKIYERRGRTSCSGVQSGGVLRLATNHRYAWNAEKADSVPLYLPPFPLRQSLSYKLPNPDLPLVNHRCFSLFLGHTHRPLDLSSPFSPHHPIAFQPPASAAPSANSSSSRPSAHKSPPAAKRNTAPPLAQTKLPRWLRVWRIWGRGRWAVGVGVGVGRLGGGRRGLWGL